MRECWTNRNSHDPATAAPRPQVLIDRDELDRLRGTLQQQRIALQSLLQTRGCLTVDGQPEIAEEISAQFDITLEQARQIQAAMEGAPSDG